MLCEFEGSYLTVFQKTSPLIFDYNFNKWKPFLLILSMTDSGGNYMVIYIYKQYVIWIFSASP